MTVRLYNMTVATWWSDPDEGVKREYEKHFEVARSGNLRPVRTHLSRLGVWYFQLEIFKRYGKWIPRDKIRIGFEREKPARKVDRHVRVRTRTISRRGREKARASSAPDDFIRFWKRPSKTESATLRHLRQRQQTSHELLMRARRAGYGEEESAT